MLLIHCLRSRRETTRSANAEHIFDRYNLSDKPPDTPVMAPARKISKVEKARQYLSGGAVLREDSDDELGLEDNPWQWIYEDQDVQSRKNDRSVTPRKRKASSSAMEGRIVGARMGSFQCRVGDTVLLKAEGNQAWVGIICDLFDGDEEEEGEEKMAKFMWFSSEEEIRNKSKKRDDCLEVNFRVGLLLTSLLTSDRMNSISQQPLTTTLSLPSTAKRILSHSKPSTLNTPPGRSRSLRRTMARYLFAGEVVIHGQQHTRKSSNGRIFTMVKRISHP